MRSVVKMSSLPVCHIQIKKAKLLEKKGQLGKIETISMDMSSSYVNGARTHPSAKGKICFDRFHVIQDVNKNCDGLRKSDVARIEKQIVNHFTYLGLSGSEEI